jgi:hypothetical protein
MGGVKVHPARSKVLRRWFFASVLLALALILVIRFTLAPSAANIPAWRQTLGSILDNLAAAAFTSLALGLAYVLLFPAEEQSAVEVLQSHQIERVIIQSAREARRWAVRARTANYFTRVTLPQLADAALSSGGSVNVRMQVLDPENENLLASYARFRSNHPGAATRWTTAKVRREIYAAILMAALVRGRAPRMDIEVGLSPAFWVMSLDLSDDMALLTGQDRGDPAMMIHRGSRFYDCWSQDFDASFTECRKLRPELDPELSLKIVEKPTDNMPALKEFFISLGMNCCSDVELREIIAETKLEHHYA